MRSQVRIAGDYAEKTLVKKADMVVTALRRVTPELTVDGTKEAVQRYIKAVAKEAISETVPEVLPEILNKKLITELSSEAHDQLIRAINRASRKGGDALTEVITPLLSKELADKIPKKTQDHLVKQITNAVSKGDRPLGEVLTSTFKTQPTESIVRMATGRQFSNPAIEAMFKGVSPAAAKTYADALAKELNSAITNKVSKISLGQADRKSTRLNSSH